MKTQSISRLSLLVLFALSISFTQAQKYDLKLRLTKGTAYQAQQVEENNVNVKVMGMEQKTQSSKTYDYSIEVTDVQDGIYDLKVTYDRIATSTTTPQGDMSYDSKTDSASDNQLGQVLAPMVGESFTMKVDEMGKILEVQGGKELMEKAISKMEDLSDEQRKMIMKGMEEQLSSESLSNSMAEMFVTFPAKKVKAGKSWKQTRTVETVAPLLIETVFTLDKVEDGKAYISYTSEVTPGEGEPKEMMGMTMEFELEGVFNGSVVMDLESGWIVESNIDQDLGGEMRMDNPAMGVIEAPMTLQGNVKVTSNK